jgi:glycerophosphoryl diester phosphodiesterase
MRAMTQAPERRRDAPAKAAHARFTAHKAILSGRHPGNSLSAIRECFDAGIERIELDIHSLAGDDYIVYHDRRLEGETTGTGSVGRATPDDVRTVSWKHDPSGRPPLLSEVVELARACETEFQFDLKDWRPLPDERLRALSRVVEPIKERVIVSTGQDWNLRRIDRCDPELPWGFDPGHYIDHAIEGTPIFLPRTLGAYGYRDDHPLAFGRTEAVCDYLEERFEMLGVQSAGAREYFISYRLVLQMLDDGFNVCEFLHQRGIHANVWTLDWHGRESIRQLERLLSAGVARVTTNTLPAWHEALANPG